MFFILELCKTYFLFRNAVAWTRAPRESSRFVVKVFPLFFYVILQIRTEPRPSSTNCKEIGAYIHYAMVIFSIPLTWGVIVDVVMVLMFFVVFLFFEIDRRCCALQNGEDCSGYSEDGNLSWYLRCNLLYLNSETLIFSARVCVPEYARHAR